MTLSDFANIATILSFIVGIVIGSTITFWIVKLSFKIELKNKKVNKFITLFQIGKNEQHNG